MADLSEDSLPDDVRVVEADGRTYVLIGTAHVSRESAETVRAVIERERPDCVCVELDVQRYQALSQRTRFESLDLKQVIRSRQLAPLLANLLLAAYQRRLGGALGVVPGTELLAAAQAAEELGVPVAFCDRDVRITLRRAWAAMSLWGKAKLLGTLLASAIDTPELDEAELRRLRELDVVTELVRELGQAFPDLKRVLIDERDGYLCEKMRAAPGDRIVAVVGAGHVAGMLEALRGERRPLDLASVETVPPVSRAWKWLGWGIPATIVAALVTIGVTQGAEVAGRNLVFWIVANGAPSSLGALLALAHPATVVAAFAVAPVTSLTPVIGAGYVLAFLQAWLRPPRVSELESVTEDAVQPRRWWKNRLLKIFLVFVFTTLGSLLGTWVGAAEIARTLLN